MEIGFEGIMAFVSFAALVIVWAFAPATREETREVTAVRKQVATAAS